MDQLSAHDAPAPFDPVADDPGPAGFVRRHRVHATLAATALLLLTARPTATGLAAGLALVAAGEALRVWAAGVIGKVHKNRDLADAGPYRWIRHPLYLGSFAISTGYAAMNGHPAAMPLVALAFWGVHGLAIAREERQLENRLGEAYRSYRAAVPALIPCRTPWAATAEGFRWVRTWQNREHHSILATAGFTLAFAARWMLAGNP